MAMHVPDSWLSKAEHDVQHWFMKPWFFNSLLMCALVLGWYLPMRDLPDRRLRPQVTTTVRYKAVELPPVAGPLRLAGAWRVEAGDRRFGGLSGLAIDRGRFVAVSDLGAAVRFDPPSAAAPVARIVDLADGAGERFFGRRAQQSGIAE